MADVKEFLNPKSMMTPGVAGGLTVSISMPIAVQFGLSFKWIALIVSLLLSFIVVLQSEDVKPNILKGLYIILNTLIIFSVSMGAGITIDPPPKLPDLSESHRFEPNKITSLFSSLSTMPAYAKGHTTTEGNPNKDKKEKSDEKEQRKSKDEFQRDKEKLKQEEAVILKQKKKFEQYRIMRKAYDKRWSW